MIYFGLLGVLLLLFFAGIPVINNLNDIYSFFFHELQESLIAEPFSLIEAINVKFQSSLALKASLWT